MGSCDVSGGVGSLPSILSGAGSCTGAAAAGGERAPSSERNEAPNGVGKLRRSTDAAEAFGGGLRESLSGADSSNTPEPESKLFNCCPFTIELNLLRDPVDLKSGVATKEYCWPSAWCDGPLLVANRIELLFTLGELDATISPACICSLEKNTESLETKYV